MALTLIHAPQTPPLPSSTVSDAHDYQGSAQVQTTAINLQNGAGHSLIGATTGDLLYAVSPTVLGGTQSLLAGAYPLLAPDGTAAAPSYAFTSQPGLGMLRQGGNAINFTAAGVPMVKFSPGIIALPNGAAFAWSTTVDATAVPDTYLYRRAANSMGISSTGADPANGLIACGQLTTNTAASVIAAGVALTNGAGVGAGTITNAPAAGNPTKWIGINDNGTIRYVPAW